LDYDLRGSHEIDLGLFARQPLLWVGNPALAAFSPCKDGWDHSLEQISPQVCLTDQCPDNPITAVEIPHIQDSSLASLHNLCSIMLFGKEEDAIAALTSLREILEGASLRVGTVIRRRLESLARHPMLALRCAAYEVLLLDEPVPDYSRVLPTFLLSGKPFLCDTTIDKITSADIEERRLISLRKRLRHYRTQLDWTTRPATFEQFEGIFTLLENLVYRKPQFYFTIRSELVKWALHDIDKEVAKSAEAHLLRLSQWLESRLESESKTYPDEFWEDRIVFDDRLTRDEVTILKKILLGTTFLKQSTMLAFDEPGVDIRQIPVQGIWISRVFSFQSQALYRISINTLSGRHYDLLVSICHDEPQRSMLQTVYWTISLQGFVGSRPVVRRFGCYRPELGAMSMAMINDLTVWERIRELAELNSSGSTVPVERWKQLFIRGMSAFFTGWYQSEKRIIPGPVIPANVVVPTSDFRNDVKILSLADWKPYTDPISLIHPLIRNFYLQTVSNYPACRKFLEVEWIFEACTEALGTDGAFEFLGEIRQIPKPWPQGFELFHFSDALDSFLEHLTKEYHVPLSLQIAVERYQEWETANPQATVTARENQVLELHAVYQLGQYGDLGRYFLYRHTYFAKSDTQLLDTFDRLLKKMISQPEQRPTQLPELSDLMSEISDTADRLVASVMVFPSSRSSEPIEITAFGKDDKANLIIVTSSVHDRRGETYSVREPKEAAEIGRLYRMSIQSGFPISVAEPEKYLLVVDSDNQIVGGICYRLVEPTVAHLDGIAISNALKGHGLGSALLEEFCQRMDSQGIRIINTLFLSREFFKAHGFQTDREWSGLVRFLGDREPSWT
jgi:GNAT superfamily N-acetyltransferase